MDVFFVVEDLSQQDIKNYELYSKLYKEMPEGGESALVRAFLKLAERRGRPVDMQRRELVCTKGHTLKMFYGLPKHYSEERVPACGRCKSLGLHQHTFYFRCDNEICYEDYCVDCWK